MSGEQYMRRALELAKLGFGTTSPNPSVGCVIERDGKIIGEGFTSPYGGSHAEVNAINDVDDHGLLPESTVYVTLEPCAHFGKTPPCADLLIRKNVKKVVIACRDPFEEVDGKGIEKLKNGGVEVELGMLEKEAIDSNKRFFTYHLSKRPYVILKWAQTADGFIARKNFDSKWISNPYSRQLVHKWRAEEDAILVGTNTAKYDDPELTARDWNGKNPTRVLIDKNLDILASSKIFNDQAKTIIFNQVKNEKENNLVWVKLNEITPAAILEKLYDYKIQSLIVEGGSKTLNDFIDSNCWDETRVFESKSTFEDGIKAPSINGKLIQQQSIEGDQLSIYQNG